MLPNHQPQHSSHESFRRVYHECLGTIFGFEKVLERGEGGLPEPVFQTEGRILKFRGRSSQ